MIDWQLIDKRMTDAAEHYAKSAPTVADWIDDVYVRLQKDPDSVRATELMMIDRLWETDHGNWMQPNFAANNVYKLLHRLGRDTVGQIGF